MPLPPPGKYGLILPPFPFPLPVVVGPPPLSTLTMGGQTAPYDALDDVWAFAPNVGATCKGGSWEVTVPDKHGLPVTLAGPCLPMP